MCPLDNREWVTTSFSIALSINLFGSDVSSSRSLFLWLYIQLILIFLCVVFSPLQMGTSALRTMKKQISLSNFRIFVSFLPLPFFLTTTIFLHSGTVSFHTHSLKLQVSTIYLLVSRSLVLEDRGCEKRKSQVTFSPRPLQRLRFGTKCYFWLARREISKMNPLCSTFSIVRIERRQKCTLNAPPRTDRNIYPLMCRDVLV